MDLQIRFKQWIVFLAYFLPFCSFFAFVLYFGWMSYTGNVSRSVAETKLQQKPMEDLTGKFEKTLQENFYRKYDFIDLAGKGAKSVGLNTFNQTQKLPNGHLTWLPSAKRKLTQDVRKLKDFNEFLKSKGIPFLFVLVPEKQAIYDFKGAPGYVSNSYSLYREFVLTLKKSGIPVLDMNEVFKAVGLDSKEVYFKTDHHWTPKAAKLTTQKAMEYLKASNGAFYDPSALADEKFKIKLLPQSFLGSHGRRVGKYFAGLDDISLYIPKFATDFSVSSLRRDSNDWNYETATLKESLPKDASLYRLDDNALYLFGLPPLQKVLNGVAPNEKKVLVLGDSYRNLFQYFLSMQFKETEHLHMRWYPDGSVAQYVGQTRADLVIMVLHSGEILNPKYFDFGLPAYLKGLEEARRDVSKVALGDFGVSALPKQNSKFIQLPFSPLAGKTYTLTNTSTDLENSKEQFVQMTLQNLSTNQPVVNRYFVANSKEPQKWIFSVPERNSDTFGIYLYAGTKGHTQGAKASIDGIQIQEGIAEGKRL